MCKIISASVTPFDENGDVDTVSAARLFQWGLRCRLDGFFIFGNMGEWPALTIEMRGKIARAACEQIGNKARIILGINDTSLPGILNNIDVLSRFSHSHWATLLPPQPDVISDPVGAMHKIADNADRPVFLYNLPQYNGIELSVGQFREILSHPNVIGVKNSAGRMRVRKELLLLKREIDFELYEGDEWAIDEALIMGLDGAIVGFGSMGGKIVRAIADAVIQKDLNTARHLQMELIEIFHTVYGPGNTYARIGQKYGLYKMGIMGCYKVLAKGGKELTPERCRAIDGCILSNPEWFSVDYEG